MLCLSLKDPGGLFEKGGIVEDLASNCHGKSRLFQERSSALGLALVPFGDDPSFRAFAAPAERNCAGHKLCTGKPGPGRGPSQSRQSPNFMAANGLNHLHRRLLTISMALSLTVRHMVASSSFNERSRQLCTCCTSLCREPGDMNHCSFPRFFFFFIRAADMFASTGSTLVDHLACTLHIGTHKSPTPISAEFGRPATLASGRAGCQPRHHNQESGKHCGQGTKL
jgi:hypothetical protein